MEELIQLAYNKNLTEEEKGKLLEVIERNKIINSNKVKKSNEFNRCINKDCRKYENNVHYRLSDTITSNTLDLTQIDYLSEKLPIGEPVIIRYNEYEFLGIVSNKNGKIIGLSSLIDKLMKDLEFVDFSQFDLVYVNYEIEDKTRQFIRIHMRIDDIE